MNHITRLASAVAVAAAAFPVVLATPAHADFDSCVQYLEDELERPVGDKIKSGCWFGHLDQDEQCMRQLFAEAKLSLKLSREACDRAADG